MAMKYSNKYKNLFIFILALIVLALGLTLLIAEYDVVEQEPGMTSEPLPKSN